MLALDTEDGTRPGGRHKTHRRGNAENTPERSRRRRRHAHRATYTRPSAVRGGSAYVHLYIFCVCRRPGGEANALGVAASRNNEVPRETEERRDTADNPCSQRRRRTQQHISLRQDTRMAATSRRRRRACGGGTCTEQRPDSCDAQMKRICSKQETEHPGGRMHHVQRRCNNLSFSMCYHLFCRMTSARRA